MIELTEDNIRKIIGPNSRVIEHPDTGLALPSTQGGRIYGLLDTDEIVSIHTFETLAELRARYTIRLIWESGTTEVPIG